MTIDISIFQDDHYDINEIRKLMMARYAPQNGSATATYFERMAYIEHRFYEWVYNRSKFTALGHFLRNYALHYLLRIWKAMSLNDSLSEVI